MEETDDKLQQTGPAPRQCLCLGRECHQYEECQGKEKYTPSDKPVFMGIDWAMGDDRIAAMYVNKNVFVEMTGEHLNDALAYAAQYERYCHFCRKLTETKDESCIVCGLSKTNKE